MEDYVGQLNFVRFLFERGLAGIYLVAFMSSLLQFPALLGEHGLLPTPDYLRRTSFRAAPSLFHFKYSDRVFEYVAWLGVVISSAALLGLTELLPPLLSWLPWLLLWIFYMSIVNVGQVFYGFGWETMLLEAGFFACFLGSASVEASPLPILALRWMLFRTELGAGLIKLRHDQCWRDRTCLYYHYETQPLPNPLSWYFHQLPKRVHRLGVLFSHGVQLVAPFGLFCPQPIAGIAGALIIVHQLLLIVSGNYGWLNWLTVVLGFTAFSDAWFGVDAAVLEPRSAAYEVVLYGMALVTLGLSVKPVINLCSSRQHMNYSYNPWHIVNSYGAFGSVTRERREIVVSGYRNDAGGWREYEFKAKPGDSKHCPPVVAPYQLRLDWLMWFVPLRVSYGFERWFVRFVERLLAADPQVLRLLGRDPFAGRPPERIRASMYLYEFTTPAERKTSGALWKREHIMDLFTFEREFTQRREKVSA